MVKFILVYSMMKVLRTMEAATFFMAAALIASRAAGNRRWRGKLWLLSLVPLAFFMDYSKIFFTGKFPWFSNLINSKLTMEAAACYFGVAGLLAVRSLAAHMRLRRYVESMPRLPQSEYPANLRRYLAGRGGRPQIQVYLWDGAGGPFAGGVGKPFIAVPKAWKQSLSKEEFAAVLSHEVLHIRLGHVWLLSVFAFLKVIWWVHPMVYLCDRRLRENMEYSSDEGAVALGGLSVYEYGGILLKALAASQKNGQVQYGAGAMTTFATDNFAVLKRRLELLGAIRQGKGALAAYQKKKRRLHIAANLAFCLGVAAIAATSYPRYTRLEDISVYDETLHPLTYDLAAEGIRAEVSDGEFHISSGEFQKLVCKYRLKGDCVYFGYGTIMKVPGVGGGGQVALVQRADPAKVSLLGKWELADQTAMFILKYLL